MNVLAAAGLAANYSAGAAILAGLIGGAHGVGVLAVLPMMLAMARPLVRTGDIEEPRALLTGFGPMTPLGSLVAHIVFDLVTGSAYAAIVL
jgi:hypothetical protein